MRVVALISGGKDSCFNMMQCVAAGHEIVALANLRPAEKDEIDSYMYQTVGHDGIDMYSESLGLPLFRRVISGNAVVQDKEYSPTSGDEVEDLFCLLDDIKKEIDFEGVSVGAILSDYQRIRVENVCTRLGCVSLAYLWRRDQGELLQEMIDCGINAIIIKTASLGLDPNVHLGQTIAEMQAHLVESKGKYGINICGEGGEYETFTLDCPLFKQSIILDEYEKVIHSNDAFAPVGYLKLKQMHLVNKSVSKSESDEFAVEGKPRLPSETLEDVPKSRKPTKPVKKPLDYLVDLIECTKADCCDGHVELCQGNLENNQCGDVSTTETIHQHHEFCGGECGTPKIAIKDEASGENNGNGSLESQSPSPVVESSIDCGDVTPDTCQTRETISFPSCMRVTMNPGGWMWVMGIDGKSNNNGESPDLLDNPMRSVLQCLQSILEEKGLKLRDLVGICMYVASLEEYSQYNKEYIKFFQESRPPVRVCVEAPLPSDTPILLEAIAYGQQAENDGNNTRQCMHVQGISHWAPANIGPYSQGVSIGDIIYVAGQIGLVPGSMELVKGGAKMECKLALRSLNRILKAMDSKVELRDVVQSICFVTNPKYIDDCRQAWEKLTTNAIVEYLVVPKLPRNARVEWQIWAHKHNTAFEYEETGCYVGSGVKVRIIRRWNYENRVSAIVCRASISKEDATFGLQELLETVEYALTKLLREAEKSLECSVRVFYRIGSLNPLDAVKVLEEQFSKYAIAFSVVPVQSLVMDQTVLSLCGIRH